MSVTILGIESSCDDTSSSVIRDGVMLSNVIASQAVHEAYGGVVPELASRAHQQNIIPVVAEAIKRAGIDKSELSAVAFHPWAGFDGFVVGRDLVRQGVGGFVGYPDDRGQPFAGARVGPFHQGDAGRRPCSLVPVPLPVGFGRELADHQGERLQRYGGDRADDRRRCR